jgi:hypothetical protein
VDAVADTVADAVADTVARAEGAARADAASAVEAIRRTGRRRMAHTPRDETELPSPSPPDRWCVNGKEVDSPATSP